VSAGGRPQIAPAESAGESFVCRQLGDAQPPERTEGLRSASWGMFAYHRVMSQRAEAPKSRANRASGRCEANLRTAFHRIRQDRVATLTSRARRDWFGEKNPDVSTISRAGSFTAQLEYLSLGMCRSWPERRRPNFLVEICGQEPASVVGQLRIHPGDKVPGRGSRRVATMKMLFNDVVGDRDKCLAGTLSALGGHSPHLGDTLRT
jgi:hypothetical protein